MVLNWKWFILLFLHVQCEGSKPSITPNESEIHLNENDPLTITCTGSNQLHFRYPRFQDSITSLHVVEVNETNSTISLKKEHTVGGDTGWYGCVNNDACLPKTLGCDEATTWVYVYVKSNATWFVSKHAFKEKYAAIGKKINIDCRPTSLDYEIKIFGPENKEITVGGRLTYDPMEGFTLENVTSVDTGDYRCVITMNDTTKELKYHLTATHVPDLKKPTISGDTFQHIKAGETLRANCSVEMEKNATFWLDWNIPTQSRYTSSDYPHRSLDDDRIEATTQLEIINITKADAGEYVCLASTLHDIAWTSEILTVDDDKQFYVNISQRPASVIN